jgi:hypothetical protein
MPGRTAIDNEVRVCPTRLQPALELPGSVGSLAELAVDGLGWSGSALNPVKLLGRRIVPVAELLPDAHAERLCFGSAPVLDRTEIATWVWPEMHDRVPPPAALLTGVIAPSRHWRTALTAAVPFARFTSAAIVVPRAITHGSEFMSTCLIRARQFGIAVLSADAESVQVELPGRCFDDAPPIEHTAVSRWVNEVVYQQLIDTEVPAPSRS